MLVDIREEGSTVVTSDRARQPATHRRLSLAEVVERNLDLRWEWLVVGGFIRPGWPRAIALDPDR